MVSWIALLQLLNLFLAYDVVHNWRFVTIIIHSITGLKSISHSSSVPIILKPSNVMRHEPNAGLRCPNRRSSNAASFYNTPSYFSTTLSSTPPTNNPLPGHRALWRSCPLGSPRRPSPGLEGRGIRCQAPQSPTKPPGGSDSRSPTSPCLHTNNLLLMILHCLYTILQSMCRVMIVHVASLFSCFSSIVS